MRKLNRAFTLVEMLVVIGIIAVLLALLVPAGGYAISASRNFSLAAEVSQLSTAVEAYKRELGDYPPSMGEDYSPANRYLTVCERHLRRCYPKMTAAEKTYFYDNIAPKLDGAEAIVMWLSAVQNDERNPFTSASKNFRRRYDFADDRLFDGDGDGFPSYRGAYAKESSFVYFDSRTYSIHSLPAAAIENCQPAYRRLPSGTVEPINPNSFQIFCAGQDGEYGQPTNEAKLFPDHLLAASGSPLPAEDDDNLTNFSEGKRLADHRQ